MLRLKELRKNKGISQQRLADDLNVSRSTVAMWETQGTETDNPTLIKIAEYFEVTTDYLLGIADTHTTERGELIPSDDLTEYLAELHKRPEMRMLFSVSKKASKEDVEKAVKIIEMLKGNNE